MKEFEQWNGFEGRLWKEEVNVRDFIQNNYTQYDGDEEFPGRTDRCNKSTVGQTAGAAERRACKRRRSGHGDRNCYFPDSLWSGIH